MSYQIDDLQIEKTETGYTVSSEDGRTFNISFALEVDSHWFCSYESIRRILSVLDADQKLNIVSKSTK